MLKLRGFVVTICTNGTLIDESLVSLFKEFPPFVVDISIYGSTPEKYQAVTNRNLFHRMIKGLELLHKNNIAFALKVPLTTKTIRDLSNLDKIARRYNVPFRVAPILYPKLNQDQAPLTERIPASTLVQYLIKKGVNPIEILPKRQKFLRCVYARNTLTITADNKAVYCGMMRTVGQYIDSLEDFNDAISSHFSYFTTLEQLYRTGSCGCCKLADYCFGCPAMSYLHLGDPKACVPYLYDMAIETLKFVSATKD